MPYTRFLVTTSNNPSPTGSEGMVTAVAATKLLTWQHDAIDAAASDEITTVIGYLPLPTGASTLTITGVWFIPLTAITHHATNYVDISLVRIDVAGQSGDIFARSDTSTDDWAAEVARAFTLDPLYTTWSEDGVRGFAIRMFVDKISAGVKLAAGSMVVQYTVS